MNQVIRKIVKRYKENPPVIATKKLFYDYFTREKYVAFGNLYPEKTIYIIRGYDYNSPFCIAPIHNLLANYFYVVSHIIYAQEKGWIPVVDQQNYPEYNTMSFPINGSLNAWEYFWNQPSNISLEEAYCSKNVVLSRRNFISKWDLGYDINNYYNKDLLSFFYSICNAIHFNRFTQNYINEKRNILPSACKILGVSIRYGGHSKLAQNYVEGHPIQPEIDHMIQIVSDRMKQWNMDYIYLASDNESSVSAFKNVFHDKLIVLKRTRAEIGKEYSKDREKKMYSDENLYLTSLDYLTEMMILSYCDGLIGSITSGFRFAVVQSVNNCKYLEILSDNK